MSCDVGEVTESSAHSTFSDLRCSICPSLNIIVIIIIIIIRVFCPRAGLSLQTQEPRLQFCSKAVFHCKLRNPGCSFTRDGQVWKFPIAELILQAFSHFTYVTAHSHSFPSLHLRHSLFSNPSLALPTSQLILKPFCCFTYITAHSPTLVLLLLRHRSFTYVTWRAAHAEHRAYTYFNKTKIKTTYKCLNFLISHESKRVFLLMHSHKLQ